MIQLVLGLFLFATTSPAFADGLKERLQTCRKYDGWQQFMLYANPVYPNEQDSLLSELLNESVYPSTYEPDAHRVIRIMRQKGFNVVIQCRGYSRDWRVQFYNEKETYFYVEDNEFGSAVCRAAIRSLMEK